MATWSTSGGAMLEIAEIFEGAAAELECCGRPDRAAQYLVLAWKARDCCRRHFDLVAQELRANPIPVAAPRPDGL